jgi:endoglycosylceramidase
LLIGVAGLACSPTSPPPPTRWQVSGLTLRDPDGRRVVLRGANLCGEQRWAPYLGWHGPADYQRLSADWGMNAIRFVVTWAAIEPQRGRYDDKYLDEVIKRLEWARQAGLLVVIDMHQDVFGEGFSGDGAPRWACDEAKYAAHTPIQPWFLNYASPPVMECYDRLWTDPELGAAFAAAWQHLSARLAGRGEVLGFDIMNEPYPGTMDHERFERERLAPFYLRVIEAVRQVQSGWIAFAEPALTRNMGFVTALPPLGVRDVVYAPHSYDMQAEQGRGFDPTHRDAVIDNIRVFSEEAKDQGAALWIGEYGGVAEQAGIGAYMDAQYDGAAAVGASSMYWEYTRGPGYGMVESDGREKAELMTALVRPYPERVAGDQLSFSFDEATRELVVQYVPDLLTAAPTELSIPERVYPTGYQVICQGCRYEKAPGRLHILAPPTGSPASVAVRP